MLTVRITHHKSSTKTCVIPTADRNSVAKQQLVTILDFLETGQNSRIKAGEDFEFLNNKKNVPAMRLSWSNHICHFGNKAIVNQYTYVRDFHGGTNTSTTIF